MADQRLDNRELDEDTAARAGATSFGHLLAAEGQTTVALDAAGNLVCHLPDGTEQVIAGGSANA